MRQATPPSPVQQRQLTVGSLVACPDTACDQVAEIIASWTWPSTAGPLAHVRTRCLAHHVFTPRLESIVTAAAHVASGSVDRAASHA
jgi:hypothetical protein